jgi:excisionase family DNA binding protein
LSDDLLNRAGWTQKRIGEEVGLKQNSVSEIIGNTDDPRNRYPDGLIDEAAAKYDDDVFLSVASAQRLDCDVMGTEHRLTYKEAAKALGISTDAVRMRVRRGTLPSERDQDGVKVILNADQLRPDPDDTNLNEHLREEVLYLREENQRKDHLIAALIQKVPALPAATDERRDVNASHDAPMEGYSDTGSSRENPQNQSSRGWWTRLFR